MGVKIISVVIIDIEFIVNAVDLILGISDTVCIGTDGCAEEAGISVIIISLVKSENNVLYISLCIGNHKAYKDCTEICDNCGQSVFTGNGIEL